MKIVFSIGKKIYVFSFFKGIPKRVVYRFKQDVDNFIWEDYTQQLCIYLSKDQFSPVNWKKAIVVAKRSYC